MLCPRTYIYYSTKPHVIHLCIPLYSNHREVDNLTWTDNSTNETGFKIQRRKGTSTSWSTIKTVGANVTSYNNIGLSVSTLYHYRVRAYNSKGYSAYSNEADATTLPPG